MRLLFLTQKIDKNDDDLAFVILWVKEFIRQGYDVRVICLEKGEFDNSFPVYSLGKEDGVGKIGRITRFFKYIFSIKYDSVFVHMNPEYVTLGGWFWFIKNTPIYLWYTHYSTHIHLKITAVLSKRMFAATKQSLPQYDGNPKKIILGHGIDVEHWTDHIEKDFENNNNSRDLVSIHRICRSKRLEIAIRALTFLPQEYNLSVYGRDVEKDYYVELQTLVRENKLENRVVFHGPVPMDQLKDVYPKHRLMINMAPETIDKTVLEAMVFGVFPVTTKGNIEAVGLDMYPKDETPESVASFILSGDWQKYNRKDLLQVVEDKHSLPALIKKIDEYIATGK
jgi:glycosyltransferase involved in cell wall biosynthesis